MRKDPNLELLRHAVADLQKRVGELETQRNAVLVSVTDLRGILEEGIYLCGKILELSRLKITKGIEDGASTNNDPQG